MLLRPEDTLHPYNRALRLTFNDAAAWKKHALGRDHTKRIAFLNAVGTISGMNIFRASYIEDARAALRFEAGRMDDMRARGVKVPHVLAHDPDWAWMITSSGGESLNTFLRKDDLSAQDRRSILRMVAETLSDLHQNQMYHGWPNLQNLTIDQYGVGLIDLEHNPLPMMSLAEAQARDAFLFLNSASKYERDDPGLTRYLAVQYGAYAPHAAVAALGRAVHAIRPIFIPIEKMQSVRMAQVLKTVAAVLPRPRRAMRDAIHTITPRV